MKSKEKKVLKFLKGKKTHVLTVRVNPVTVKRARLMGLNMSAIMSDALERFVNKEWA